MTDVQLQNANNILSTIDERLFTLMKEQMNTEEQGQFIDSFQVYLKYGNDYTAFVINLDNVWKWIGFNTKGNAKRLLISKFIENKDYINHLSVRINGLTGSEKEIIMLNVSTFKKFCIKASTKRANFCIENYLQMEDIYKKYILEQEYSKQLITIKKPQNNNVLTTIDERLFVLMKEELNTGEQQQFVNSFKLYLKYGYDDTAFVIDFDNVWKWVGFTRKDNAKTLLTKKFCENIDYLFDRPPAIAGGPIESQNGIKETILLTVNAFKRFCMKASTKRADDICNYYLKMEKIMHQYTNEKLLETQNKLNKFIEYDEELFWNENQINDYNNKNVLYVAFIGIIENERIYKFGKSEQIYTREFKQHQKFFNIFKMRFVIECDNMSFVEKEFKKFVKSKNLLKNIEIKQNNLTELFTITEQQDINYIIENLIKLVDENPLPAIKNLKEELLKKNKLIAQKDIEIEHLKEAYNKIHNSYQKLRLNIDQTSNTNEVVKNKDENSKNEIINEIIENTEENNVIIIEKSENVKHQGPFVQIYDSENINKLLFVYPSITEATRGISGSSYTQIKFASTNKLVYLNYRWFLVDRTNTTPFKSKNIGETVEHKVKKIGIIAMLNKEKTKVERVFINQMKAGEYCNQCKSAICNAIKYNGCLNDHYWYLWNEVNIELQNTYLENNTLPILETTCPKAVKIEKIDPDTNNVLELLNSISDVTKKYRISAKTLKKYSNSGEVYNDFKWNILS